MKVLLVHQNFPGQYLHLARHLARDPANDVVFITQRKDSHLPGVRKVIYTPKRKVTSGLHHYLAETEHGVLNAQEVARVAYGLRKSGFKPDVILGHNGWGEIWYLKDVFPHSPLLGYFEFFYKAMGADVGFDPSIPLGLDTAPRVRTKNLGNLLGLTTADAGQCATHWQKSLYPRHLQSKLSVLHEGVDTGVVSPNADAVLDLKESHLRIKPGDEVVTYVARNLEPYRGFQTFMRSLPEVLRSRPNAQIVIVGGDDVSYGAKLPQGTFRQQILDELKGSLDLSRVHFLGKVPYSTYLSLLQVSRVHVYLTYPFVLSWSMLEAMSAGCLVVGSRTAPVEEVIHHGENGLLVDFFSAKEVACRVIEALSDARAHAGLRLNARQTIVDTFDLKSICLPAQLRFIDLHIPSRVDDTGSLNAGRFSSDVNRIH